LTPSPQYGPIYSYKLDIFFNFLTPPPLAVNVVCARLLILYLRLAAGITKWHSSVGSTAKTFAHEIAHNLGIYHDFDKPRHRSKTCGPGIWQGGITNKIMNYGTPKQQSFSECSNLDFKYYYTTVVGSQAKFCLKGK